MEEMIAVGRVWHALCFTCGGTSKTDIGCNKVLKRDGYLDHDNQPFCNACYAKHFKPKGFGYGNTLNTDYGPSASASESATQEVTAGVSKLLSTPETKPAAPPAPVAPAAPKPPAPAPAAPVAPAAPAAPVAPLAPAAKAAPAAPAVNTAPSNETNEKFKQAAILQANVPSQKASIAIGSSTAALKGDKLHAESGYVGDNDEVDESEW